MRNTIDFFLSVEKICREALIYHFICLFYFGIPSALDLYG